MLTSKEKSDTKRLPMMPIRDVVIFPYMMTPFVVGRESSVRALEEALAADKKIFLATQHDASIDEERRSWTAVSTSPASRALRTMPWSNGPAKKSGKIVTMSNFISEM